MKKEEKPKKKKIKFIKHVSKLLKPSKFQLFTSPFWVELKFLKDKKLLHGPGCLPFTLRTKEKTYFWAVEALERSRCHQCSHAACWWDCKGNTRHVWYMGQQQIGDPIFCDPKRKKIEVCCRFGRQDIDLRWNRLHLRRSGNTWVHRDGT